MTCQFEVRVCRVADVHQLTLRIVWWLASKLKSTRFRGSVSANDSSVFLTNVSV